MDTAAVHGHHEVVTLLLDANAELDAINEVSYSSAVGLVWCSAAVVWCSAFCISGVVLSCSGHRCIRLHGVVTPR